MTTPEAIYAEIVTADAVRQMRNEHSCGMTEAKRFLQRRAMRQILADATCDPGVRFILDMLITDYT